MKAKGDSTFMVVGSLDPTQHKFVMNIYILLYINLVFNSLYMQFDPPFRITKYVIDPYFLFKIQYIYIYSFIYTQKYIITSLISLVYIFHINTSNKLTKIKNF